MSEHFCPQDLYESLERAYRQEATMNHNQAPACEPYRVRFYYPTNQSGLTQDSFATIRSANAYIAREQARYGAIRAEVVERHINRWRVLHVVEGGEFHDPTA